MELVCGIETHVELSTKTKIFCSCTTGFGGEPNTHCCPVCTGQPGAIPILNKSVIEYAIRAGLALNCTINTHSHMDRKNYVYPDLPKAYQISQFDEPLCENGYIELDSKKRIGITRIHIEEDAGKLVHRDDATYIDYNRGGVPLIEIVSEPDISSPEEAQEFISKLRLIMKYIGVSDCKMQEGSMRCDVNLSLRPTGQTKFGTRTETKNINSISNIKKAMNKERERQEKILNSGGKITQSTMRYDADTDTIHVMRTKENADDYRYFPEPDILSFTIDEEFVKSCTLPELPDMKLKRYIHELNLPEASARDIYKYPKAADFLDKAILLGASPKNSANMLLGCIYATLNNDDEKESFDIKVSPESFYELIKLMDEKKINKNKCHEVLLKMLHSGKPISDFISKEDIEGINDNELFKICTEAVNAHEQAVKNIKEGKDKAMNVIFGFVMRQTKGRADMKKVEKSVREIINSL